MLKNSTISDNTADGHGGGIYNRGSDVTLTNSVVSGNRALSGPAVPGNGGGVYSHDIDDADPGRLTLIRSTVSDNASNGAGGGLFVNGAALIVNSTVSNNTANRGGGLDNIGNGNTAMVNSTVTGNTASEGGAGVHSIGGEVTLSNTIVAAQQSGPDCGISGTLSPGKFTSLGHNLDSDGSCELTEPGDRPNANANVGPLADNGGPTHADRTSQRELRVLRLDG